MNLDILYNNIGKKFDIDNYLGCLMPLYLLYPEIPKFQYFDNPFYFMPKVKRYFNSIEYKDLKAGDLIIFNKKFNHFGIYASNDKFFHCLKDQDLRISRLSNYSPDLFFRRKSKLNG